MTKIEILKNFRYGSVSDPQRMLKGTVQEVPDDVSEEMLGNWLRMKWVQEVEEEPLGV